MIEVAGKPLQGITFVDLFAGIGGFHYALASMGGECVFASEWDKYSAESYRLNFGMEVAGDITKIEAEDIPSHDILCAGFPCQAFSVSGKQRGFDDTRGTLFFDIIRIIKHHRPKVLLLENVKNLARHDGGNTLRVMLQNLEQAGYNYYYKIMNASDYGLPQNRERIYIVAFDKNIPSSGFRFPESIDKAVCLHDIIEHGDTEAKVIVRPDIDIYKDKDSVCLTNKPIQIGKVGKGGQGERIYHPLGHAITLSAHGGGVGSKTGLYLIDGVIRKLSLRECARLQGFPDSFEINKVTTQAYKQFGNSLPINVVQYILIEISKVLNSHG